MTDWLDEVVTCKYCGNKTTEGEKIWLNGKCMCPQCYMKERAKEDYLDVAVRIKTDHHDN